MATINANKILFVATFLSKLAFALLFTIGTFLIHTHIVEKDLVKSCGGDEEYTLNLHRHSHCYINTVINTKDCEYWIENEYNKKVNVTDPWDEKVVDCIYNVRGGLFTASAVFFVFSIILEDPRVKTINEKVHFLISMLHALGGLFLFGSVVSEMDIMKRVSRTDPFWVFNDYEDSFVYDYPDVSNALWIIGTLITMLCYAYMGYLYMRERVLALLTYITAALGSFFLFVTGILRSPTVAEDVRTRVRVDYFATYHTDRSIFPLMLTGAILFFIHSFMYYFAFYDDTSADSDNNSFSSNNELNAILPNDEESNPNASNNTEQDKDEAKQRLVNHAI